MIRREAESHCCAEWLERVHLAVEPVFPPVTVAVPPAKTGTKVRNAEVAQPSDGIVEAGILPVEPLHDAHVRRVPAKVVEPELGRAVLLDEAHVEVTVVG